MTPPSRTSAAGSGSKAACNKTAHSGGDTSDLQRVCSQGVSAEEDNIAGNCAARCNANPRATNSRGRTWRNAMRALMRCTSPRPFKAERKSRHTPAPCSTCKAAMASNRCCANARSRGGSSNQRFKVRLPMPVMQVSINENKVGLSSPRSVCVNSRLRRVVAGKSIRSSLRSTRSFCTCVRLRPCVCSA